MKSIRLVLFCLLSWLFICGANAATFIQAQSLNAAASVTNGNGFGFKPSGAITSVTIYLSGSAPTLSYQTQTYDPISQTWVPTAAAVALSGLPAAQTITLTGPFIDVRVVITAYTSGTLTANMVALY